MSKDAFLTNNMNYDDYSLDDETLLLLYKNIIKPRLIEEKMLILLRQGKISKWFAGIGQEAIAVGVTMAMQEDEYILPMHRNLVNGKERRVALRKDEIEAFISALRNLRLLE